jgi:hypothetical protein
VNYAIINPRFWQGGTGKQILKELDMPGTVVALYLITGPHANQSGVYYCPITYIAIETHQSNEEVEACLVGLERLGFLKYDYEAEVVWVFNMVKFQVQNWPNNKKDNRHRGVLNALATVPESHLKAEFLEFWSLDISTGSSEGTLRRGLEGGSKGLLSEGAV